LGRHDQKKGEVKKWEIEGSSKRQISGKAQLERGVKKHPRETRASEIQKAGGGKTGERLFVGPISGRPFSQDQVGGRKGRETSWGGRPLTKPAVEGSRGQQEGFYPPRRFHLWRMEKKLSAQISVKGKR